MSPNEFTESPTDARTHLEHPVFYENAAVVDVSLGATSVAEETATRVSEQGAELPPSMTATELPQGTLVDRIKERHGEK